MVRNASTGPWKYKGTGRQRNASGINPKTTGLFLCVALAMTVQAARDSSLENSVDAAIQAPE
jgi:hypothetical protein